MTSLKTIFLVLEERVEGDEHMILTGALTLANLRI